MVFNTLLLFSLHEDVDMSSSEVKNPFGPLVAGCSAARYRLRLQLGHVDLGEIFPKMFSVVFMLLFSPCCCRRVNFSGQFGFNRLHNLKKKMREVWTQLAFFC